MDKNNSILLQIKDIVREYILPREYFFSSTKRLLALDGISLTVNAGESFGIVGESGCGKSTLARTIMGLEYPQSGEIFFMGKILHSLNPKDLRRIRQNLQMIFQDPYGSLDPRQNVGNIVSEPLTLFGEMTLQEKLNKAITVLEKVGLSPNDISKFPHEFSGGQRQRIAIARALITKPALIVADEPVSALDVSVQAQVLNLMMDLRDEHGLAYLFISHDLSIVRQVTTRIAVMYAGKIIETGSTENLFKRPLHPYTSSLLEAIPKPYPLRKDKNRKTLINPNHENIILRNKPKIGCSYANHCPHVEEKCKYEFPPLQNSTKSFSNGTQYNSSIKSHKVACYKPLN